METRELYQKKFEAQLNEWSAKVDEVKARGEKLTAKAQLDAQPHLDSAHGKMEAAKAKLREIAAATDDTWEEVKTAADNAWKEATAAVEGAYDALKAHHEENKDKKN